jgi:hypothetical protein
LRIDANGDFAYDNKGFLEGSPLFTFDYTISDGAGTDDATVSIKVVTNSPVATDDVGEFEFEEGRKNSVEGIVTGLVRGKSSGDTKDEFGADGAGDPAVIQVEYFADNVNTVYALGVDNSEGNHVNVQTNFGILEIDNVGRYHFKEKEGLTSEEIGEGIELKFTYTIQDGDTHNSEQDTATLTITISPPSTTSPPPIGTDSRSSDQDIEFNQTSSTIDTGINAQELSIDEVALAYSPDTDDLSDILTDGHTGGLEKYLAVMGEDEGSVVDNDLSFALKDIQVEDVVVLAKGEADSGYASLATVSNGLLAEGAIIISDAAEATSAPIAELDSTELS